MFGFIDCIKPKCVKAEDVKECEDMLKAAEIGSEIIKLCFGALRPDQEDCPPAIIYNYKKLLELGDGAEIEINRCAGLLDMYLTESQSQDFKHKVSQLKEYKEYKEKNRIKKLQEDF